MQVPNYEQFGGRHWETAALCNTLAHAGVVAPHTGKPLSEAMCLGLAGGIATGYSFCPSIPKYDLKLGKSPLPKLAGMSCEQYQMMKYARGSGLTVVGRCKLASTNGAFMRDALGRVGATISVKETTGIAGAHKSLVEALEAGKPAFVWCVIPTCLRGSWAGGCGMYLTVIHGLDETVGTANFGDRGPTSFTMPLDELKWSRNRVCSLKNRLLTFEPPKELTAAALKKAVLDAVRECANGILKPYMKTFGLPGLLDWSKFINNPKNAKGWQRVYPGGMLYLGLRDVFDSIETAGNGGGLFRPMYAEFLDEAASLAGNRLLADCAARYRELAKQWNDLAESCLPNSVKPFKQTKQLLLKRLATLEQKGAKGLKDLDKLTDDMTDVEAEMRKSFPLAPADTSELLASLSGKIVALHDAERAAAEQLAEAVAGKAQ